MSRRFWRDRLKRFLDMWETRGQEQENANLKGKFLAVLPISANTLPSDDFFTSTPTRQTVRALDQLTIQMRP